MENENASVAPPQAGAEMDALIAEKVLGWTRFEGDEIPESVTSREIGVNRPHCRRVWAESRGVRWVKMACQECGDMPQFSTRIDVAWELVIKFQLTVTPGYRGWKAAACNWSQSGETSAVGMTNYGVWSEAETAPLAICIAALAKTASLPPVAAKQEKEGAV
jgi:Phage ABA sandwich domain